MEPLEESRLYNDNKEKLTALWDTANIVSKGKMLIRDKEGHSEVDIQWVLEETTKE
jgi:hypothetical protein